MKKTLLKSCAIGAMISSMAAGGAQADNHGMTNNAQQNYVFGGVGVFLADDVKTTAGTVSFDAGSKIELGIGRYNGAQRMELSFSGMGAEIDDERSIINGDIDLYNFSLGAYYDIYNRTKITPYVGAKIGYSLLRGEIGSEGGVSAGLMAGVSYEINDRLTISPKYELTITDIDTGNSDRLTNHGLTLNLTHRF